MDRPRLLRVPEGSGEQKKKMEETGCEVINGAPTTLAVKGQVSYFVGALSSVNHRGLHQGW